MRVFFSIGSNLDDREFNIEDALDRIVENIGIIHRVSSFYETEPWGFTTDERFLNIAAEAETDLNPGNLMNIITKIENRMGRIRENSGSYTSRIIDIDILFYSDMVIHQPDLKIPHPLMQERKFVLVPFNEIAPDFVHPLFGQTISELLAVCSDTAEVKKLENRPRIGASL